MPRASRNAILLGFAAIYLIWGSTYLAIRLGVATIPPFLLAGVRFVVGGGALYLWTRARGVPPPERSHWVYAAILGVLMATIGNGFVTYAELMVPSGLAALLVSLVPIWIVLIDWLRPRGARPKFVTALGLTLGLTGFLLLISPSRTGWGEIDRFGVVLLTLASLAWAVGSVYSRHAPSPASQIQAVGMQMLTGGFVMLIIAGITGEFSGLDLAAVTTDSLLSLVYLTVFGSTAYTVYLWLLKASTPAKVATYAYVNPVIALILGTILAGELLSFRALACSALILLGVAFIVTVRSRENRAVSKTDNHNTAPSNVSLSRAHARCELE